ncbi:hypothetical protein [uncultured Sulfitobacter sp.]|uniref:hypothetical protein n=1 Tax=uncultured Sulfitobacter sp. TaxID=191468 RepID=UPI0026046584|nr:hypothetical protein [uncultured Sulfitobacter sp.]
MIKTTKNTAYAVLLGLMPLHASAFSITDALEQFLPAELTGMGQCEAPADEPFFQATGCTGHMQHIWNEDHASLKGAEAHLLLWANGLVPSMTSDTTFFTQGPAFMASLPPKLQFNLQMANLRYPETALISLHDQLSMVEKALGPVWRQMATERADVPNMIGAIKGGLRQAGLDGKPSIVLGMMGRHDGYHIQSWAMSDPDAAAEFMARLDRLLVKL